MTDRTSPVTTPPRWSDELLAVCLYGPIALAFAAGGWCLVFARIIFGWRLKQKATQ